MDTFSFFLASFAELAKSIATKSCKDSGNHTITTPQECIDAASTLNLTYIGTKNVWTTPKGCYIDYNHLSVFFSTTIMRGKNSDFYKGYIPICRPGNKILLSTQFLITPFHSILHFVLLVWHCIVYSNFRVSSLYQCIIYLRNFWHHNFCCSYCCDCCCNMCMQ